MSILHVKSNTIADWTGTVTVGNSAGISTTAAATDLVRPTDWNSGHNLRYTLSGNTSLSSTASGTNVVYAVSGPGLSIIGSSDSVIISSPPHVSSFRNPIDGALATTSFAGGATSHCVAFNLPEPGSFSFFRIPVSLTIGSTSSATTATTLTASCNVSSTWNMVVYSLGTGASSRSLQNVASGSCSWVAAHTFNISGGGTQYAQSWAQTYWVEGNSSTISTSTQRSTSTLNWSSGYQSNFTGGRFIDIPFATSLSAGPYWVVFGNSTSSSANSTIVSGASVNAPRYSNHYHITQLDSSFGVMGLTTTAHFGGGVFSTAGGGTTASIPLVNISSTASQPVYPVQFLRSA